MKLDENILRVKELMGILTEDQKNYVNQPIVFVGSAGAGKSTTAKAVSEKLGIPYIDVDAMEGSEEFEKSCADDGIVVNIKRVGEHNYGPQNLENKPDGEWIQIQDQYKRCVLTKILQKYGNTKVVIDIGGDSIKNSDLLENMLNLFVFGVPPSPDEDAPYIEFLRKNREDRAKKMGQPELEGGINNDEIQQSIDSIREYYRGKQNIGSFDENGRRKTTEELVDEITTKLT
jgi:adenylate kinase family enzyme